MLARDSIFRTASNKRMVWIVSVMIILIMTVYGAALILEQQRQLRIGIELRGLALARGMAAIGASAAQENLFLIQEAFAAFGEQHDVRRVLILDPDRMVIASTQPDLIGSVLHDTASIEAESLQSETLTEGRAAGLDGQTLVIMEPLWFRPMLGTRDEAPGLSSSQASRHLLGWVRLELSLEQARYEGGRLLLQQIVVTALLLFAAVLAVTTTINRLNRNLYESEAQLRSIVESAGEGIIIIGGSGVIESVNPLARRLFGLKEHELLGKQLSQLVAFPPETGTLVRNQGSEAVQSGSGHVLRCETVAKTITGQSFPIEISFTEMTINGTLKSVCLLRDIAERRRIEREMTRRAHYDVLTGLPNRVLFRECVMQGLRYAKRHHLYAAMLFLDLDRFKQVNDLLGHKVGDLLLQAVSKRLADAIRQSDSVGRQRDSALNSVVSRLGGDEFTIFLADLAHAQNAGLVAKRILDVLADPLFLDSHEISVTGSLGIALFPGDAEDFDLLLKHADMAMYQAKEEGGSCYRFFSASVDSMVRHQVDR